MTIHRPDTEEGSGIVFHLPSWTSQLLVVAIVGVLGWSWGHYNDSVKNDTSLEIRMTASEADRAEIHNELRQLNSSILEITKSNARSEEDLKQLATGETEIKVLMQEHITGEQNNWTKHAGTK